MKKAFDILCNLTVVFMVFLLMYMCFKHDAVDYTASHNPQTLPERLR